MARRQIIAGALLQACGIIGLAGVALLTSDALGYTNVHPILYNVTHSMPLGLYVRTFEPIHRGSIVATRMPAEMIRYMADVSPGWAKFFEKNPIIKPVVAVAGDKICRDPATGVFTAAGEQVGVALTVGPLNVPLPVWTGCKVLDQGEIAVGSHITDSIDARYWGPTQESDARTYRPLWTETN